MESLCAAAASGATGTITVVDGRSIRGVHIDAVSDAFLTFTRPGGSHPQILGLSEIMGWQPDAGASTVG